LGRDVDLVAGGFQHFHRRLPYGWEEVIIEGIGPEQHLRPPDVAWAALAEPLRQRLRGKGRQPPLRRNAAEPFGNAAQPTSLREDIGHAWHERRQTGPPVDQAHRIGLTRSYPPGIVMRQKFGLVGGHIDLHGAVALAALAGQAQVERFAHVLTPPAVGERVALKHLEEQARPRVECISSRVTR
jgi:hypothetical protein